MIIGTVVFIALYAVSPVISDLTAGVEFDPFTELVIDMLVPIAFLLIVISIGVSAVRSD